MSSTERKSLATSSTALSSPTLMSQGADKYPVPPGDHNYPEVAHQTYSPMSVFPQQSAYQQPPPPQPPPQQYQYGPGPKEVAEIPQPVQKRNPWGLSPLAFGLLVGLLTALIVGAAVGGGVAGAMSGNNDSSNSAAVTATTTVTVGAAEATTSASSTTGSGSPSSSTESPLPSSLEDYAAPAASTVRSLDNPGCGTSRITTPRGDAFDLLCGVDFNNNIASREDSTKRVFDITATIAYSLSDCLYSCMSTNYFRRDGAPECLGVTWTAALAVSNQSNYANCWNKNGTSSGYQCNNCISARLVT